MPLAKVVFPRIFLRIANWHGECKTKGRDRGSVTAAASLRDSCEKETAPR